LHLLGQDLEVDIQIFFKTIIIEKDRFISGKCKKVKVVRETIFIYSRMLNSVKAFLIGKQKACEIVKTTDFISIIIEKNDEEELAENQRQTELYDIMISMADAKLEVNDIKIFIKEERQQRDQKAIEERIQNRKFNKNNKNNKSKENLSINSTANLYNNLKGDVNKKDNRSTSLNTIARDTKVNFNKHKIKNGKLNEIDQNIIRSKTSHENNRNINIGRNNNNYIKSNNNFNSNPNKKENNSNQEIKKIIPNIKNRL